MEEKIKKLKLTKKQRAEIRKKVNEWNKDHQKRHNYWIVEVESSGAGCLYCVRTNINPLRSTKEEVEKARYLANVEHERLYPDQALLDNIFIGQIRSFVSERKNEQTNL